MQFRLGLLALLFTSCSTTTATGSIEEECPQDRVFCRYDLFYTEHCGEITRTPENDSWCTDETLNDSLEQ